MKKRNTAMALACGFLGAAIIIAPNRSVAQAPPGPISHPESRAAAGKSTPKPKPKEIHPRTTLAGAWKLNHDESDDPRKRMQGSKSASGLTRTRSEALTPTSRMASREEAMSPRKSSSAIL